MDCFAEPVMGAHSRDPLARNDGGKSRTKSTKLPDGKLILIFSNYVKPKKSKYFAFAVGQISDLILPSHPIRGAARDRHERVPASSYCTTRGLRCGVIVAAKPVPGKG
jgi:hypothetical protein